MKYITLGFILLFLSFASGTSGVLYYYNNFQHHIDKHSNTSEINQIKQVKNPKIHKKTNFKPLKKQKKSVQKNKYQKQISKTSTKIISVNDLNKKPKQLSTNNKSKTNIKNENNKLSKNQTVSQSKYTKQKYFVLYFRKNSHKVSEHYKKLIVEFIKTHSNSKFKIFLRTADLNSKQKNKKLGKKRYEAITEIIQKQVHISTKKISYYVRTPKSNENPDKFKTKKWRRAIIKVLPSK